MIEINQMTPKEFEQWFIDNDFGLEKTNRMINKLLAECPRPDAELVTDIYAYIVAEEDNALILVRPETPLALISLGYALGYRRAKKEEN